MKNEAIMDRFDKSESTGTCAQFGDICACDFDDKECTQDTNPAAICCPGYTCFFNKCYPDDAFENLAV